jgi:hypothetical protein
VIAINTIVTITTNPIGITIFVIIQNANANTPTDMNVARNQTMVSTIIDKKNFKIFFKNFKIFFMIFNHLPYGISL